MRKLRLGRVDHNTIRAKNYESRSSVDTTFRGTFSRSNAGGLPPIPSYRMETMSSMAKSHSALKSGSMDSDEMDALPTIDEMALNLNFQSNMMPFDLMDSDLKRLVADLKKKKKNDSDLNQHMNIKRKKFNKNKKSGGANNANNNINIKKSLTISQDTSQMANNLSPSLKKQLSKKSKFELSSNEEQSQDADGNKPTRLNTRTDAQKPKNRRKRFKIKKGRSTGILDLELRPKYKKAKSVPNGSLSILMNVVDRKKQRNFMNFDHDLDEEILKLKVSLRKEIPFEKLNMGENAQRLQRLSANNKLRMKMVKSFIKEKQDLITKLKLNSQILNNWIDYVALKTIGVKYDEGLFNQIFWLYDLNGDGSIDQKEFALISNLFRGRSIPDRVKMFFSACDPEMEGYIDRDKITEVVLLGLKHEGKDYKTVIKDYDERYQKIEFLNKKKEWEAMLEEKVEDLIRMIAPLRTSDIRENDLILACQRSPQFLREIDFYLSVPDLFSRKNQKFSISSFLTNQTLISYEGTHLSYMRDFIAALKGKEEIHEKTSKLVAGYNIPLSDQ